MDVLLLLRGGDCGVSSKITARSNAFTRDATLFKVGLDERLHGGERASAEVFASEEGLTFQLLLCLTSHVFWQGQGLPFFANTMGWNLQKDTQSLPVLVNALC